ncbi:MAG: cobalamin biosynthesis protein CobD [Fusobacteriaceae bacterium]|nr:cobalamin biosynthesis protein CobD [Fusobacteriaceae bacterium]MBN2838895.1 cobalamin biosynthesis protein CobD [Fusobacteriaceae bacterium]
MNLMYKIVIAYFLDLIFGDPYSIPHPIVFIGKLIKKLENFYYSKKINKKISGFLMNLSVLFIVYLIFYFVNKIQVLEIYFLYTILASKSLVKETKKVYLALKNNDIKKARLMLSYLVSRNTEDLEEKDIIKGTVETCSENITDGIIAPLFYMFIGGLPLAMTYKAINTLDSMVGYKNEKYKDFGFFSAKLDDVANFIPSRLSGLLFIPISCIFLGYDFKNSIKIFFRDRKNHSSPNSAHTESAVAGALNIQLGGPTKYFGVVEEKKYIGDKKNELTIKNIRDNHKIIYLSGFIGLIFFVLVFGGIYGFTWR